MPSKKKPRPLFEVPVEIGTARESGWVYRSEDRPEEPPHPHSQPFESLSFDGSVVTLSAQLLAHALATVATGFALTVTVAVWPFTAGRRALNSMAGYRSG
jgi:hypothetical protein